MTDKEIIEVWEKEDGLVSLKLASEIIPMDKGNVSRAVTAEKIKSYLIGKTRFLSFKSVMKYKAKRSCN